MFHILINIKYREVDIKHISHCKKQLIQANVKLNKLENSTCILQNEVQSILDGLNINAVESIFFNKINNIFSTVNMIFLKMHFIENFDANLLLLSQNTLKSIKLLISQVHNQLVYLTVLNKIKEFLFAVSKFNQQKQTFRILNNNSHVKILYKITNLRTPYLNPAIFLANFELVKLASINLDPNIKSLNVCIAKLQCFIKIAAEQPKCSCNFNDLITIANLINIYYSCLGIFKNHKQRSILYKFSSKCFLKNSHDLDVTKNIIKYIIDCNHVLSVELINTNTKLQEFKNKLLQVIPLMNFQLNNEMFAVAWSHKKVPYDIAQAKCYYKQFIEVFK